MKLTRRFSGTMVGLLLVLGVTVSTPAVHAQSLQGQAQVRGLNGLATYSTGAAAAMPLRAGTTLPAGSVVKTGPGTAVDVSLSHGAGIVRLLQNSTLSLNQFTVADSTRAARVEIQLSLLEGSMVGFDKKLPAGSRYEVKVSRGIADINGSKYRLSADGYLVLLEGDALMVFVPQGGEPVAAQLKSPPAVYFSPAEGIRPAPDQLVREVVLQTKGKLHGR